MGLGALYQLRVLSFRLFILYGSYVYFSGVRASVLTGVALCSAYCSVLLFLRVLVGCYLTLFFSSLLGGRILYVLYYGASRFLKVGLGLYSVSSVGYQVSLLYVLGASLSYEVGCFFGGFSLYMCEMIAYITIRGSLGVVKYSRVILAYAWG